jgi:hypothetical protein
MILLHGQLHGDKGAAPEKHGKNKAGEGKKGGGMLAHEKFFLQFSEN